MVVQEENEMAVLYFLWQKAKRSRGEGSMVLNIFLKMSHLVAIIAHLHFNCHSSRGSYRQSRANTNKIARALTKPDCFKLSTNNPMFEEEPNLVKKKMNVASFHLSQVGGHTPKMKKRSSGNSRSRQGQRRSNQSKVIDTNWRLDPSQEEERLNMFGRLPRSSCREYESNSSEFPLSLKRKYLRARNQSVYMKTLRKGSKAMAIMGTGRSSTILQKLEKSYVTDNNDEATQQQLDSMDDQSEVIESNVNKPTESFDSWDADCRSVDFDDESSFVAGQTNEEMVQTESVTIQPDDVLDGIFGQASDDAESDGRVGPTRLASLFDAAQHRSCVVIAPPGMALDYSDEESESNSSGSSDMSMNDDLCAFFEKGKSDLRVEPYKNSCEDDQNLALKTPFSDHGSVEDFGADADNGADFGTPREIADTLEAATQGLSPIADASKCLETTLIIEDRGNETSNQPGQSVPSLCALPKQKDSRDHASFSPVIEKENIDVQLSLSPSRKEKQSNREAGERHWDQNAVEKANVEHNNQLSPENKEAKDMTNDHADTYHQQSEGIAETSSKFDDCSTHEEEVSSPLVAFRLPTPPPSSDEESEDDSSSDNSTHQSAPAEHSKKDASVDNQPETNNTSSSNQFEICDESMAENDAPLQEDENETSFFQLPTQFSSSEGEDDDDEEEENGDDGFESGKRPPDGGYSTSNNDTGEVAGATMFSQAKQSSVKDSSMTDNSVDISETKHVQFKLDENLTVDLTDSPAKESFPASKRPGSNSRMSLDSLTDSPIKVSRGTKRLGGNSRMSLDSLADTPIKPSRGAGMLENKEMSLDSLTDTPLFPRRQGIEQQRKSLDSLTDTPLPQRQNADQQRKRLKAASNNRSRKAPPEKGTAEKAQRQDRVKKRIEEKYRCRFLDCEAANDDSEDSDEEDALRRIEDGEISE